MTAPWGSRPATLPSRRYRYMTARCPLGCGWWSIPPAVRSHVRRGRCARQPWPDRHTGTVLVPAEAHATVLALLPAALKRRPEFSDRALFPLAGDRSLRGDVLAGTVVVSPLDGIPARRWLDTVAAAVAATGAGAVESACTAAGYARLEATFGRLEGHVRCPDCGDWVTDRGLVGHRRRSTRCRWLVAHRTVEAAFAAGWRDPWSQRPGVPTRWAELSHGVWRRFVRVVDYPEWCAVLVDPQQRLQPRRFAGWDATRAPSTRPARPADPGHESRPARSRRAPG